MTIPLHITRCNLLQRYYQTCAKAMDSIRSNTSSMSRIFTLVTQSRRSYPLMQAVTIPDERSNALSIPGNQMVDVIYHKPTFSLLRMAMTFGMNESEEVYDASIVGESEEEVVDYSFWFISTLKRRKKKMNKHKLRKRRKKERLKSK